MKKTILLSLILISGIFLGCSIPNINDTFNEKPGDNKDAIIENEVDGGIKSTEVDKVINQEIDTRSPNMEVSNTNPVEKLAKCLSEKGVKMYGTKTCPYCLKQEEMFGENFKHINYINCMEQPTMCGEAGISGVPAWEFADGNKRSGLQSFEALASMAGCEYGS